jgi:putative glycosyltransferase
MQLSIVSTLYRSAAHLREFHARARAAAERIAGDWELILVDDGSPDESLAIALELQRDDPRLTVIELSRNFGHHHALLIGLQQARGERVFLVDSDLEEEPEHLVEFWRRLDAEPDLDVVYGVRTNQRGRGVATLGSLLFDRLFNLLGETRIAPGSLNIRLMRRRYVDALQQIGERELFLTGVFDWLGFRQVAAPIQVKPRGATSYSLRRRLRLALASLTSFSSLPLKVSFWFGFVIAAGAFAYSLWIVLRVLVFDAAPPEGWASLMASIWFLGGTVLMAIGVLGAYVARIYREVKHRPVAVIRARHEPPARAAAPRGAAAGDGRRG